MAIDSDESHAPVRYGLPAIAENWIEQRADDIEKRRPIAAFAAYQEGDPEAVTAY